MQFLMVFPGNAKSAEIDHNWVEWMGIIPFHGLVVTEQNI